MMGSLSHSVIFHVRMEELFLKGEEEAERKGSGEGGGGFRMLGPRGAVKEEVFTRVEFGVQVGFLLRVVGRRAWLEKRRGRRRRNKGYYGRRE
jgi:hypothetical protein